MLMKTSGIEQLLFPRPQQLALRGAHFRLPDRALIQLSESHVQSLLPAAQIVRDAVKYAHGRRWGIHAGKNLPLKSLAVRININPETVEQVQGYRLVIASEAVSLEAHDEAGAFYGAITLAQLIKGAGDAVLPGVEIYDYPDFAVRGVMLDISRDKVPRMETLYQLVDMLAGWKYNQLQLYTEHTFAYQNHPLVWADASPVTAEEILALDEYCRQRFIELVPNQNSFGHMHRWLKHERYRHLAEVPEGVVTPFTPDGEPYSLCPTDERSLVFLAGLYDELLPHFSSRLFNAGCDETFDLGMGRSANACAEKGVGNVYLDFLLEIYQLVRQRGRQMMFWGDIINQHPELIPRLPADVVPLEWGYEAEHPFDAHCQRYAEAGLTYYVCPGTSSWNSISGRTDNALANLRSAAQAGLAHGATGYLVTDWGDNGHWQPLPVSYLGFAAGAGYAWAYQPNLELDVAQVVSRFAFGDPSGECGRIAYELGNIYHLAGIEPPNSSALFWVLQYPLEPGSAPMGIASERYREILGVLDELQQRVEAAHFGGEDGPWVRDEFRIAADLLEHACWRGIFAQAEPEARHSLRQQLVESMFALLGQFKQVWLRRNRPGGLTDSLSRLQRMAEDYQA